MKQRVIVTANVRLDRIVGEGRAIATMEDGRKLFVWGGLPGEMVEVEISKKRSSYAEGVVTKVIEASPERVEPKDPGSFLSTSPWQILSLEDENRYKVQLIDEAFAMHYFALPASSEMYSDSVEYGYRNKIEFSFWWNREQRSLSLAFFKRGSHQKIEVNGTSLASDAINEAAARMIDILHARRHLNGMELKTFLVRSSREGKVSGQLYVKSLEFAHFTEAELEKLAIDGFELIYSNPKSPASVITERMQAHGEIALTDTILDAPFRYATEGFFQINLPVYEEALRDMHKAIPANTPVVDLYSGVGTIGLTIGGEKVTLVEVNEHAVREMRQNIETLGRKGATAVLAPSEGALEYITSDATIIIDPPRAGLHQDVTNRLLEVLPERIIYLSCNPTTQARDVALLSAKYKVSAHRGYNFFPHTPISNTSSSSTRLDTAYGYGTLVSMKLARRANGFTLIELIVVIAVIGILAAITVFGFTRFQQDGRDAQRSSSVTSIVESLEKYFNENGEYPGCAVISAPAATVANSLPDITADALKAPSGQAGENALRCETLSMDGDDFFEYLGDGSETCLSGSSCLSYTLRYKEESRGTIASIESRRNTDVATSGVPVLTVGEIDFTDISVTWSPVLNASQYRVQISTNNTFDENDPSTEVVQTSYEFDGLTSATQYWMRVQAVFIGDTAGPWSNVISPTTATLTAASLFATANSQSQITVSWGAIDNAQTYTLYQSTSVSNGALVNPTAFPGLTSTSSVRTGLATDITYYYQVRGINGGVESPLSNIANATTFVPAPTCSTSTLNSNTQITISWSAVASATSYNSQRSTNNSTWTNTTNTTNTSQAFTGLNNGTTYYFRVQAMVGATASAWASCPSRTTGVSGPSSYSWTARPYAVRAWNAVVWMPGAERTSGTWYTNGMYIAASCAAGASPVVQLQSYYAYSNNSSPNGYRTLSWTSSSQDRYVVGGSGSWKVWWHGWVACQSGGTRYGEVYLGNAGPY